MATQEDIRRWLSTRPAKDLTHMLVVCDTFDYEDYPVYVSVRQKVREVFAEYDNKNMQRVMEVYSYGRSLESQLKEERASHFD
jgi:hypothetical protein